MKTTVSRRCLITAVLMFCAAGAPAAAQVTVFDPSNYASNVLQAARALDQVNNQIVSLQNQALSLINQARNLAQLPYSALSTIQQNLTGIGELLGQAQRIAFDVRAIEEAYARDYQGLAQASDRDLLRAAQARWENSAAAFKDALTVQAGVVAKLPATAGEIQALASASQGAVGVVQAAQAGNQLLAVQTQQLTQLIALMAAQGRAQALEQADRAASREQAREQFRRFIGRGEAYQPAPAEMFR